SIYTGSKDTLCRTEEQLINTIAYEQSKVELPVVKISYTDIQSDIVSKSKLSFQYLPTQATSLLTEVLALSPLLARKAAVYAWKDKGNKEQIDALTGELTALAKDPTKAKDRFKNGTVTTPLPELY